MENTIIKNEEAEIKEIVDRETQAWDQQDLDKLMSIFHPDMVWPWPRNHNHMILLIGFLK
jgi:ketosteroid isomerase-like protein